MEFTVLDTFIINAVAERSFINPKYPHFVQTAQSLNARFGSLPAIPGYSELAAITAPHIRRIQTRGVSAEETGLAASFIVGAVNLFIQRNKL
jgi:hypothetical protein